LSSVIRIWRHEAAQGREEVLKDRPCVIVAAVERKANGEAIVAVLPTTHRQHADAAKAVEIPPITKQRLGLNVDRSWVMIDEANQFVWPGYDLRKTPGSDAYDYGLLPPRLFENIMTKARAWLKRHGMTVTAR
jgi:PemK-like, MazF-like toxin of type II toxin-antitoxin system